MKNVFSRNLTLTESNNLYILDANRFTWLVAVLASCSFAAGLLSFFVPKKVDQQDKSGEKDDRQLKDKHEKDVKVNEAFEDDFEEVGNDQRV